MAGAGVGCEGEIPAEGKVLDKLGPVEVVPEGVRPGGDVEGLVGQRYSETVHVCRKMLGGKDPTDVLCVDGRAGTAGQLVARARRGTGCHNLLAVQEMVPQAVISGVEDRSGIFLQGVGGIWIC